MEPDPGAVDAPAARTGAWRFSVALVVLAALVAGAVYTGLRYQHHRDAADRQRAAIPAQQAVLAAARAEGVALTTISYQTARADLARILAGATGSLRAQFAKQQAQLPGVLARTKSVSKGTALSSALTSLGGNDAKALVAVDANVSGTDTGSGGVLKHYRMVVTLQRVNGKWLASDVAFAGQPQ